MTSQRRGFILVAVVFALVLLAALVAGGFFATLQDLRAGRNASAQLRDRLAAKAAIASLIGGWDPRVMNALAVGSSLSSTPSALAGTSVALATSRLSGRLFLVRASATDSSGVTQSLETIARLRTIELLPLAAVRARFVDPALALAFSGVDQNPSGWNCAAVTDTIPPLIAQPGASDSSFFQFGSWSWAQILSWIGSIPAGGDSIPVTYSPGDLAISGSQLLGLAVVDGNLTLGGGAELDGVALVRGALRFDTGGGLIRGAVVASQVITVSGFTTALPVVSYSSCGLLAAILSRAVPGVLPGQGIAPVY